MRKTVHLISVLLLLATLLVACRSTAVSESTTETESERKMITVGFSQLGAESDWRSDVCSSDLIHADRALERKRFQSDL